jgi:class 3 adenylate cyclase/putative methionine-R-sulfoxide reductase with GAF domain
MVAAEPTGLTKASHYPVPEGGWLDRALQQQTTIVMTDATCLAKQSHLELRGGGRNGAIIIPMKMEGMINALFIVSIKDSLMHLTHQQFLEWSAGCLSLAVERNRLSDAVVKRNRELDSIKQIGSALASSTFDINQVLNYTMEMIRVIMNVESGTLYLVEAGLLQFAVDFSLDCGRRRPLQLKLGQGIAGYVAARGESMMLNENHDNSAFLPEISTDQQDVSVRSALCVPMISQGRVIGVIEVLNKINGDFGASDAALLQSIASSVSIAIENANLYKETVAMAENERGIRRIFQKFVPKQVLDKILHGSASGIEMVEELKTLTLINVDIRGFSILAKQLGPQKTVALLNAFFSLMGGIVFKHHGIVDKYLGDGFLAIFGAPVSSVADADNAVAAALEMQSSLDEINNGLAGKMGVHLQIGISVHTGEVVVGNIGFDMKMDYTVIGDSVNDVFRLQEMVRPYPDCILLSEKTLRAARLALETAELDRRLGQMKIYKLLGKAA